MNKERKESKERERMFPFFNLDCENFNEVDAVLIVK